MPRRSFLSTVGAAIAAGLLKILPDKAAGSTDADLPDVSERVSQPVQQNKFDERLFGHGLPVEQANNGRDYVVIEGKPVVLMPNDDVYADLDPDTPVVLTEDGIRVVDPNGDLSSKEGMMVQLWKDPDSGEIRSLQDRPPDAQLGRRRDTIEFCRNGQLYRIPILVRAWRKGDPE